MTLKPYYYPRPSQRPSRFRLNRPKPVKDDEGLTGYLRGLAATDIEERFGRALDVRRKSYVFQIDMPVEGSVDWKSIDFIVDRLWPTDIYGQIGHDTNAEQGKDLIREALLNETFRKQGLQPLTTVWWWELSSQELANEKVRDLF
ncbi:hypothetical protein LCGC14_1625800 [marine sediment metagenome]|uniref:Uncharacterized protein n=1 Tax=marine sediment metagenome TaxID=412755 RepID=A0A0F9KJN2_9ZZZZ